MDGLSLWHVMQWILGALIILALMMYLFHGMDALRRWYLIHDISKYTLFALFIFFFQPLLWLTAGTHTCNSSCPSDCSRNCNNGCSSWGTNDWTQGKHVANAADAMHWINHKAKHTVHTVSSANGAVSTEDRDCCHRSTTCLLPSLFFTDLLVATMASMFVFYQFLDPWLHRQIHRQAILKQNEGESGAVASESSTNQRYDTHIPVSCGSSELLYGDHV